MTTELNASQTERGAETGTNVGQPWEAKFMTLDRLPLLCEADRVLFHQWQERQKELFEEWHAAEVEALQARVRELEGALEELKDEAERTLNWRRGGGMRPSTDGGVFAYAPPSLVANVWRTVNAALAGESHEATR